jgi:hypothetical protein
VGALFDAAFLTQFNPTAFNQILEAAIRIDLVSIQASRARWSPTSWPAAASGLRSGSTRTATA